MEVWWHNLIHSEWRKYLESFTKLSSGFPKISYTMPPANEEICLSLSINVCLNSESLHFRDAIYCIKTIFTARFYIREPCMSKIKQQHTYQQISKSWSSRIDMIFSSIKCKGSSGHEMHNPASKAWLKCKINK